MKASFSIKTDTELNQVPVTGLSKCARVQFRTIIKIRINILNNINDKHKIK